MSAAASIKSNEINEENLQNLNSQKNEEILVARWYHVLLLGLLTIFPGLMNTWGRVLVFGFREALIASFFMGSGFICLDLCLAEMTSILPFSGGAYGFVRVTLGPYLGFLVGCFESMHSLTFPSFMYHLHSTYISELIGFDSIHYQPLICFLLYVFAVLANTRKRNEFWFILLITGFCSLLSLFLFYGASFYNISQKSYKYYEVDEVLFAGGFPEFLSILPYSIIQFRGIQLLTLSSCEVEQPKVMIPRIIIITTAAAFILLFASFFVGTAQAPGVSVVGGETTAARFAFMNAFQISAPLAKLISVIGSYFSGIPLLFYFSRQIQAMALSGLFPKFLKDKRVGYSTPHWSLLIGSITGFILQLINIYVSNITLFVILAIGLTGAILTGLCTFTSFIILRWKFSNLERPFRNQLGIASAVYGFIVFFGGLVGLIGFQEGRLAIAAIFVLLVIIFSVYYFRFARKQQRYSPEEESIFFFLYVIKANRNRKKKIVPMNRISSPPLSRSSSRAVLVSHSENGEKTITDGTLTQDLAHISSNSINTESKECKKGSSNLSKVFPTSAEAYMINDDEYSC